MTSRKSLQNNFGFAYRTGLRDNSLFAVINTVFLSLFFALIPIMTFRENTSYDQETGKMSAVNFKELYAFQFSSNLEFTRYLIIAGLLIVGLLMGIMTFRFITGKKTVNVYYSLGIKRTKLFTAKYLSGLTLIAASVLLPMLVSLIVNIVVLGVNKYMITAFFYLVVGMFSLVAFSYTLTALVFSAVGTVFEGMLFSGILILFPEILFSCLQILIQKLVLGTPLGSVFTTNSAGWLGTATKLTDEFADYNPLRYFSQGLYTYSTANKKGELTNYTTGELGAWKNPDFLPLVLWLAVTAALFAFGVFVYKRRKAEIGGFIGKNKVLNFVGTFIVAFFGFVLSYDLLRSKGMAIGIAVGLVVFAVIYAVLSLLLLRNGKQFVKELPALPIQIAVTALIFVFFATGYFGAANRIPDTADVSYAKISAFCSDSVVGGMTDSAYYSFGGFDSPTSVPTGKYETENDIDFVRSVHEKLVEAGRTEPTVLDENYNGTRPIAVQLVYMLKNGKEVKRSYYGVSEEILSELQKAVETDYYQARLNKLFKDPVQKVEAPKVENGTLVSGDYASYSEYLYIRNLRESTDVFAYDKAFSAELPLELTDAQKQTLLDCLYQDLSKKTAENRYSTANAVGVLSFRYIDEADDGTTDSDSVHIGGGMYATTQMITDYDGYDSEAEGFAGFIPANMNDIPYFYITADMTATVQFLKDTGCYDQIVSAPTITAMRVVKIAQLYGRSYMSRFVDDHENFGYEFSGGSADYGFSEFTGSEDWKNAQSSKAIYQSNDASLLQSIYAACLPRAEIMPSDYIAVFAFDNGLYSKMYVPADKMPDSVKSAVEQNDTENMYY